MKGLLIKDVYTMLKETRYFLLLAVAMAFLQNDFLYTYIIVYAATLPITALAYDERVNWNRMAETLPLNRNQIVGCKYIISVLSVTGALCLSLCGKLFGAAAGVRPLRAEDLGMMVFVVCMALIVQAVNIPLMFWIGVERGRLLFILIVVLSAFVISSFYEDVMEASALPDLRILLLAAVTAAVVVNILSFYIGKRLYGRER